MMVKSWIPLCFRCERRAEYLTAKIAGENRPPCPRYECGQVELGKSACYMFLPVKPPVLSPLDVRDKRPRFSGMLISAVEISRGLANFSIDYFKRGRNIVLYWRPKVSKINNDDKNTKIKEPKDGKRDKI